MSPGPHAWGDRHDFPIRLKQGFAYHISAPQQPPDTCKAQMKDVWYISAVGTLSEIMKQLFPSSPFHVSTSMSTLGGFQNRDFWQLPIIACWPPSDVCVCDPKLATVHSLLASNIFSQLHSQRSFFVFLHHFCVLFKKFYQKCFLSNKINYSSVRIVCVENDWFTKNTITKRVTRFRMKNCMPWLYFRSDGLGKCKCGLCHICCM